MPSLLGAKSHVLSEGIHFFGSQVPCIRNLRARRIEMAFVHSTDERIRTLSGGVAQFGRAPGLGPGGRKFKSCRPDWIVKPAEDAT